MAGCYRRLWLAGAPCKSPSPRAWPSRAPPPDFPLVALAALALLGERKAGTVAGFLAGLIRGVLAGTNLAAYAISRTLLGFALGWVRYAGLIPNAPRRGPLRRWSGRCCAQGLLMFAVHRGPVLPFLAGTLFSAMIDGALAMPLYALLRRLIEAHERPMSSHHTNVLEMARQQLAVAARYLELDRRPPRRSSPPPHAPSSCASPS